MKKLSLVLKQKAAKAHEWLVEKILESEQSCEETSLEEARLAVKHSQKQIIASAFVGITVGFGLCLLPLLIELVPYVTMGIDSLEFRHWNQIYVRMEDGACTIFELDSWRALNVVINASLCSILLSLFKWIEARQLLRRCEAFLRGATKAFHGDTLRVVAAGICQESMEYTASFRPNGEKIGEATLGLAELVCLDADSQRVCDDTPGYIDIHNHPGSGYALFSPGDMDYYLSNRVGVGIVVTKKYACVIRLTQECWANAEKLSTEFHKLNVRFQISPAALNPFTSSQKLAKLVEDWGEQHGMSCFQMPIQKFLDNCDQICSGTESWQD